MNQGGLKDFNMNNHGCNPWKNGQYVTASLKGANNMNTKFAPFRDRSVEFCVFREFYSRLFTFSPFGTISKNKNKYFTP
jgi:hypothetical protein